MEKKDIHGFEEIYEIYSDGKIWNKKRNHYIKPYLHHTGYYRYCLHKNGKPKYINRGRIVALHFIPNPKKLKEVNHINGIKTDDSIDNLEWVTPSQNINHYYKVLGKGIRRKVDQYTRKMEYIRTFDSIADAARHVNGREGNITTTCQGKHNYAYGYIWRYNERP